MRVLLFGRSLSVAWAYDRMLELAAASGKGETQIAVASELATNETLIKLKADPIDVLVLVEHGPVIGGADLPAVIRDEAQRAILALELSRIASRTLSLTHHNMSHWLELLGDLFEAEISKEIIAPPIAERKEQEVLQQTPLLTNYLVPLFDSSEKRGDTSPIRLVWPREAFLSGDMPDEPLPPIVDVAGRARILAYGPYLPLTSGQWHAKVFLGFSHDIGKLPFIMEIDASGPLVRGFFEVEQGGLFTIELDFEVSEPLFPVEIRLISQDSAIEGQFALIEVELRQLRH